MTALHGQWLGIKPWLGVFWKRLKEALFYFTPFALLNIAVGKPIDFFCRQALAGEEARFSHDCHALESRSKSTFSRLFMACFKREPKAKTKWLPLGDASTFLLSLLSIKALFPCCFLFLHCAEQNDSIAQENSHWIWQLYGLGPLFVSYFLLTKIFIAIFKRTNVALAIIVKWR